MKMSSLAALAALALAPVALGAAIAQDASPAPVVDPQQFANMASSSNMLEIQSSELALERSQNQDVVEFAQQMVQDHTAATQEMMAAAQQDGVTPATALLDHHQQMLDELVATEGEQFDVAYINAQVLAHDEAVALFEGFSTQGEESALKTFAANTLPILRQHQEHAISLSGR